MSGNNYFQYFNFTKTERNGILLMAFIDLLLIFLPDLYINSFSSPSAESPQLLAIFQEIQSSQKANELVISKDGKELKNKASEISVQLFNFDPNHTSTEDWMRLGINEKTVGTIQKYLDHGGRFRKPEDIKKIWGFPEKKANALMPYVKIEKENNHWVSPKNNLHTASPKKMIELNEADSLTLDRLPGIGPALAHRILSFRKRLGGFYQIEQLKEVWGLRDSVIEIMKSRCFVEENHTKKMDLNNVSIEEMKIHPYFGYKTARAIIAYRLQHGDFKTLDDIQQIISIDEETYRKIIHYLVVNK